MTRLPVEPAGLKFRVCYPTMAHQTLLKQPRMDGYPARGLNDDVLEMSEVSVG